MTSPSPTTIISSGPTRSASRIWARKRRRSRRWRITDAAGRTQEVAGPGVVGEQPVLRPGESFEYQSGTHLTTPSGIMVGSYHMQTPDGRQFEVRIPAFSLDSPHQPTLRH